MGNVSGDFDGDGKTDIILYPKTTTDAKKKYWFYKNIAAGLLPNTGVVANVGAFEEILPTSILEVNGAVGGLKLATKQGWTVIKYDTATNIAKFATYSSSIVNPVNSEYEKTYTFPQLIYYTEHPLSCVQTRPSTKIVENIPKLYLNGDFNGDSLTDIIVIEKDVTYSYLGPCDVNDEPLNMTTTYSGITYLINLDKRQTSNYVLNAGNLGVNTDGSSKVYIADVNGDGKSDVLVVKNGSVKVFSLNENNKFVLTSTKADNSIVISREILLGDFNGDGKADFVIPNAVNEDNWNFFMSTGTNFNKISGPIGTVYGQSEIKKYYQAIPGNNEWITSLNENTFIANDFNGDGKTDILYQQNFTVESDDTGSGTIKPKGTHQVTKFQIALNLSFTQSAFKFLPTATLSYTQKPVNRFPIPVISNLDDANKNFRYSLLTGNSMINIDFVWYNKFDVLLKKITNGNGVIETISYQPLDVRSQQGPYSVYYNSGYENYPNIDILKDPNFFVVSMLERKSIDSYKKKIFQYYGAVSNVEGLGFLGFIGTMQTNWFDDATVSSLVSNVSKFDITRRGANIENFSAVGLYSPTSTVPSDFISRSVIEYNLPTDALQTNKVFKLKSSPVTEFDGQTSTNKVVKTTYDSNNNPLQITTTFNEGNTEVQKNVTDIEYESIPALRYMIGRPHSKILNSTLGTESMRSEELYFYGSDDLLSKVKRKGDVGTTNYVDENIYYDNFGNINRKTMTAGSDVREISFEYDITGRFLKKSTDVEKLFTTFEYNTNGTLASKTNPFLQKTVYEYDVWFKKTKETDYLNFITTFAYTNNAGSTVLTKTGSDGSVSEETFDDLGRKTKTGVKNIMGTFSYISYLYDIQDRSYKVSEPYIGSTPSQWNETKYNADGTVYKNISYTGKTTDITYAGLKTTVSDGTKTEVFNKNVLGKVISMYDIPSNIITYSYFPNGNLRETNYGGAVTKVIQDGWGRKKQLIDPSAGTFTYSYNDFGELKTEVNGLGTTTYNITSLGKLDTKTISGSKTNSTTTYIYDSATKMLVKSTFLDSNYGTNTITDYKYDSSKRIIKKTETTPYAIFIKRYTYDALGRIDFENSTAKIGTKLSSRTVRNTYKNGVPYQILDSITNNVIWQTNTVDNRGQLLTAQSGPTSITNNYDTNGFVKQFKFDKTSPSANLLTLDQFYDAAKTNFTSRSNNLFSWTENFDYDNKDRLIKFKTIQGTQETQFYDDKGRITQNNLGTYNYNIANKPYQNSSIDTNQEALGYYANREGVFNDSMEDKNGWGFEKSPNTNFYSYDAVKAGHAYGKSTLKLSNTLTTEQYVYSDKWVDLNNTAVTDYTYSGWIYSDNPQAEIVLVMKDAQNNLSYSTVVTNVTNNWTPLSKTFSVPANIKKIRLRLDNNGQGNIWFDDVQIRKTSNAVVPSKYLEVLSNVFKSPEQIEETGVEKINFLYNDDNTRSTMFYGSLDDKFVRPFRKHYSADATMEIKENRITNTFDFVTYIGGNGYTAPAIVKSDGTTQNYLYLQRDYQGSILAITDANGAVVEKRLFDAWGSIIKVQDGAGNPLSGLTIIDRGYTGHEHIQSVGIINMNGRLYDPKLRRFLQPDNNVQDIYNMQNFNRYGYVLNNPLKYNDPSGEFWNIVAGFLSAYIYGAAATGEANPFKWNVNNVMGALSAFGSAYATGRLNSYIDNYNNKPILGSSATSSGYITNEDIFYFFPKVSSNYERGLNDRSGEIYNFFKNDVGNSEYWAESLNEFGTDVMNGRSMFNASDAYQKEIFNNFVNMSVYDWAYAAGYNAPDIALSFAVPYAVEKVGVGLGSMGGFIKDRAFTLNGGYGLFGKTGRTIGNYKIEAMYMDTKGGGTFFSMKQGKVEGNLIRWDYGLSHNGTKQMELHSHFRFNIFGNRYGSGATQYQWYDPFRFWNFKK